MYNSREAKGCLPSIWDSWPLSRDEWARQHPEEHRKDVERANQAKSQLLDLIAQGEPIPLSLIEATLTRREEMNNSDRKFREQMREDEEDD